MAKEVIETLQVTTTVDVIVDHETGEISYRMAKPTQVKSNFKTSEPKKKAPKKEESATPQLIREDNKICLNTAALELMGVAAGDKIDIKYEKQGSKMVPVVGSDESFGTKGGNTITKSNTVACRGSKNTELAKYGTVFTISQHETKPGLFILTGDIVAEEAPIGDSTVTVDESDEDLPLDVDLSVLDEDTQPIDASFFQL